MALSQASKERIKKQLKNRRKTRPFKEPKYPKLIEMEFGSAIIKEIKQIDGLVKEFIIPELDRLTTHKSERFDRRFPGLFGIALATALIARIKSVFYGESISPDSEPRQDIFTRSMKRMVSLFLDRVKTFSEKQFVSEFNRQTGTDPTPNVLDVDEFINDSLSQNIALIKTIPQQYFANLERIVKEGVTKGELSGQVKKKIEELSGVQENRARVIARDQVSKLVANMEESRQRKAGVTEYIWRTKQDSRVRSFANSNGYSDHKRLEGTIQKWSNPPVTVFKGKRAGERHHPSTDIQCRCVAQPIYDEITGIQHPDTVDARRQTA